MYRVFICKPEQSKNLNTLIEIARSIENKSSYGAIVTFCGTVRDKTETGDYLETFINEIDDSQAQLYLEELCKSTLNKYSKQVESIVVQHLYGEFKPSEPVLYVVVISKHRESGFNSIQEFINELKQHAPIWKKEISKSGESWISNKETKLN